MDSGASFCWPNVRKSSSLNQKCENGVGGPGLRLRLRRRNITWVWRSRAKGGFYSRLGKETKTWPKSHCHRNGSFVPLHIAPDYYKCALHTYVEFVYLIRRPTMDLMNELSGSCAYNSPPCWSPVMNNEELCSIRCKRSIKAHSLASQSWCVNRVMRFY